MVISMKKVVFSVVVLFFSCNAIFINQKLSLVGGSSKLTIPIQDGNINDDEYLFDTIFNSNFQFYWTIEEDIIYMAFKANTSGWISIGLEPSTAMQDADMLFGWVNTSHSIMLDSHSTGLYGPHLPDEDLGGTNDIENVTGTEISNITILEFTRLLDTGDSFDKKILLTEEMQIIWAYGNSDDYTEKHDQLGYASIDFNLGSSSNESSLLSLLWPVHAGLMIIGLTAISSGIIVARYMRRRKKSWWLKVHKYLGVVGSISIVTSFSIAFVMVPSHFRVLHSYFGAITILGYIAMPLSGLLITNRLTFISDRIKNKKLQRDIHRWLGRFLFLLLILTILSGLNQALN